MTPEVSGVFGETRYDGVRWPVYTAFGCHGLAGRVVPGVGFFGIVTGIFGYGGC